MTQDLYSDFNRLMVRAHREKVSDAAITRAAGLHSTYLRRIRDGKIRVTRKTLERINHAITRVQKGDGEPTAVRASGAFKLAVCLVASVAGVRPQFILSADPAKRKTADPDWLRAARLRWIALYICVIHMHFSQASVATAANMSRANVCRSLKDLEDRRGEAEIELVLSAIEEAFKS
ncbi:hypothetical protein [Rhizobium sp. SGZ-381]|uniref:hypothetical protein n=1 Tax=Rhizobium sp. SGZ-381 TaxID=3342800 RepID=UPI0036707F3C